MIRYIGSRLGAALLVLLALSVIVVLMVRIIPGDPAATFLPPDNTDPAARAAIAHRLGIDQPLINQYFTWMGNVVQGDFGQSMTRPWAIGSQIRNRLPVSIELAVLAVLFASLWGIPAGVASAIRPGRSADVLLRSTSFLALSIPGFVVGTVVVLINSTTLRLPLIGYVPFGEDPIRHLSTMLVPAAVLALPLGATLSRFTRASLLDTLGQDYIRTARAKGTPVRGILIRHGLRNSLIPVTTVAGVQLASLIGGTIVVEAVFGLPGMGGMLLESISSSDYPTVQASVLVIGLAYVVINLVIDLLYPLIDPRVRTGR